MNIDYPVSTQVSALRRLWQQAFADDDAFLDRFFDTGFAFDRCRCVTEGEAVLAALYWFDMTCRGRKIAYLYAVATDKAWQHRGLCRALMADTNAVLANRGYAGSILVPEDKALAAMYEKMGFRCPCLISQFISTKGPVPAPCHRIDSAEYLRRRTALLPEGGVQLGQEALAFLETQALFFGGTDFLVAAEKGSQGLRCLELLGNTAAAPGILSALGLSHGAFRTPGRGRSFALYRPIDPAVPAPTYFGIAFD